MYEGKISNPYDDWQNSGYGLYMTSELCKLGGSFLIASGNAGLRLETDQVQQLNLYLEGTLVNLTIDTTKVEKLDDMLRMLRDNVKVVKGSLKASKASTSFL